MNIVLTGASGGIGFELAKYFVNHYPCKIYALVRSLEKTESLNQLKSTTKNNSVVEIIKCDLQSIKDINHFTESIQNGSIDILINNAGLLMNKPIGEYTHTEMEDIFKVNLFGPLQLIQFLLPRLSKNSHIVNIGSMGGVQGSVKFPGLSVYSASKGALAILTECLAEELREKHIAVNCLALGAADTEMLRKAFPGFRAQVTSAHMAAYIAEFAKTGHQYFNGKVLPVSLSTP